MPTSNVSSLVVRLVAASLLMSAALAAESPSSLSAAPAPLGLPRLGGSSRSGSLTPIAPTRFAVDDLAPGVSSGVAKLRRDNVALLVLEPGRQWSRPLRGTGREPWFVSFQLCASSGTVIDLGGVRLGVTLSSVAGGLQLMYDDASSAAAGLQWKPLQVHLSVAAYAGRSLAALPALTVRVDPTTDTWDLFLGSRLVADSLPLIAGRQSERAFAVRAGAEGAWLTGLVQSDEHPLFEDANANGVDDSFERRVRGERAVLATGPGERRTLLRDWKESQRRMPPPALHGVRPAPDRPAGDPPTS